jgi:nucleoside-diphosphate-sugar epimerase
VPVTVRDLLEEIGRQLGRPELVRFGERELRPAWDPPYVVGDNARLRGLTAFSPRYDLVTGLEQTIEWWRASGAISRS